MAITLLTLGLRKQFITALDKDSAAFKYLQVFFPKLSEAKVEASVFVGPQIRRSWSIRNSPRSSLGRRE